MDKDLLLKMLIDEKRPLCECLAAVGIAYDTYRRRMAEWGIRRPKAEPKPGADGYFNYRTARNHRKIMEKHVGRGLLPLESVHHINGVKSDNDVGNLFICSGTSSHSLIHASLERCAFELVRRGVIRFDREKPGYFLDS